MDLPLPVHAAPGTAPAGPGPTRRLAERLAGLALPDVDPFARRAATRHLIDSVGAMIAGAGEEATLALARGFEAAGVGAGPVAMPGLPQRLDALSAAHLAGTACHGLELDDGYRPGSVHPGTVVVPAALALAFQRGSTGAALLRAVVAGYEATCRIAAAAHPRSRWRGFHNTGIVGVFGGAAAASALLDLDVDGTENAFGIAASSAAGLFSFLHGGDVKRTHPGHAAREGLLAGLLTAAGLPAPPGVLELREGFLAAFAGYDVDGRDPREVDILAAGGNNPRSGFAVANCYMKPHACCRHIHSAIDAVLDVARAESLPPEAVRAVHVGTYAIAAAHAQVGWSEMTTAQMSFPFVLATALVRGHVGLADFGAAERADPAVLAMTRRIAVTVDPQCEADYPRLRAATVTVEAADGRRFERHVPEPYGAASNPLDDAALEEKFMGLAGPRLGERRARDGLAMLWEVEGLADLRGLSETLAG